MLNLSNHTTNSHNSDISETNHNVIDTATIAPTFAMLHPRLQKGVANQGFTIPTDIQIKAVPHVIAGRDILASSQTGSGKTAAFLLPIMHKILVDRDNEVKTTGSFVPKTRVLILTPTRELASQIAAHFKALSYHTNLTCVPIFGGVGMGPQENAFRRNVDFMVATPGRLLDHLNRSYAHLKNIEHLVLDEADRMLDMGFLPYVRKIFESLPSTPRQTMLFSATLPAPIVELSRDMLKNPASIDIQRSQMTATGIEHRAFKVSDALKQQLLVKIIDQHKISSAIVFTRTKHRAKRLSQYLEKNSIMADCIHGNRTQQQRTKALDDFRNGKVKVLVATDIASRGIDVEGISHVVNFDVPHIVEDYVHRAGRTARAGMTGYSFTLVAAGESGDFAQIQKTIKTRIEQETIQDFDYSSKSTEPLEIPIAERIAEIRRYNAACRARSAAKKQTRVPAIAKDRGSNPTTPTSPKKTFGHRGQGGRRPANGAPSPRKPKAVRIY